MASFAKTLARLREVVGELKELEKPESRKLTAERFLSEALDRSSAPLDELLERFAKASRLDRVQAAHRSLIRWLIAGDAGMKISTTPSDRGLSGMIRDDAAVAQAASVGLTSWDLWAVSVARAKNQHPDRFGPVSDPDAHAAKIDELRNEFETLCEQLDAGWTRRDIEITPTSDNQIRAKLKDIPVHVGLNTGQRIGMFLMQHE
jgi:hypothetical protein